MSDPDDIRQRLFDAAGPIFAQKGFAATTVRDICLAAKANQAAINYHFSDKDRFYIETVRYAADHCINRVPLPRWQPGTPPEQKLRAFIEMFLNRVAVDHEPAWHSRLITREMVDPTPACAEFVRDYVRPTFEMLSSILQELLPDVLESKRRLIGFSIIGQCLHYRFARPVVNLLVGDEEFKRYDVAHLTEHISEFTLSAIRQLSRGKQRKGSP